MKVRIGPYVDWFGPYQLASRLAFWAKPVEDEYGIKHDPEWVHKFGAWLADTPIGTLLGKIHEFKKRDVQIHIDRWDTWNMDRTLALIIHPMLLQLRETRQGVPMLGTLPVPEEIQKQVDAASDEFTQAEIVFNWVLDEVIWAFQQKIDDTTEDRFFVDGVYLEEEHQAHFQRMQRGFELFGKIYQHLWT